MKKANIKFELKIEIRMSTCREENNCEGKRGAEMIAVQEFMNKITVVETRKDMAQDLILDGRSTKTGITMMLTTMVVVLIVMRVDMTWPIVQLHATEYIDSLAKTEKGALQI